MRILLLAGVLATASATAANTNTATTGVAHAAIVTALPAYTTLIHFPDGSLEICPTTDFSFGFPQIDIQAVDCLADKLFVGNFGG